MWYPPQQHCQPPSWHVYMNNNSTQQQQQQRTYLRTSYYCNSDESSITNRTHANIVSINEKNESFVHFNAIQHTDEVNVTGTDYQNINSTGFYSDEMLSSPSSLTYQTSNTHWNPIINTSTKTSIIINTSQQNSINTNTSSSSTSGCWDWLLYSPDIYSHLYTPSSSFIQQHQQQQQDDDLDLLARLPTWLLVLLYPSMKQNHNIMDDENDNNDQEITSLNNNNHDEALLSMNIDKQINQVSSNLFLSSENTLNSQKIQQNRSSTPDTDDGYQSASDASRSDCSQQSSLQYDHHNSKDDITNNTSPSSLTPKRISYAAAVKPIETSINNNNNNNNKISSLSTPIIKTKINSSSLTINDMLNNNGQKLKFVAPRFERMHHAKQNSSSTITTIKDSSLTNRTQIRSNNNNNNQRNHMNNLARRR
ncbi:unnamed protein product [Rotaria sp. Silwood1]|nr:unnamed protein product [Rotaria sp. Silwood1]CAF4854610.1 unnamed protein product [Rotaria sp. Silwood1]